MEFSSAEICKDGKTNIKDSDELNLYECAEQSVYVEGIN